MQVLWELLPGARDARNQLLTGWAWLAAAALVLGVPRLPADGAAHDLAEAIGPLGVGIAVSFGAFMLGSFADDLLKTLFDLRGARALTLPSSEAAPRQRPGLYRRVDRVMVTLRDALRNMLSRGTFEGVLSRRRRRELETQGLGGDDPLRLLRSMEEPVRAELERLEGAIDRLTAEVTLRFSLLLPVLVAGAALSSDTYWAIVVAIAIDLVLLWQTQRRGDELLENLANSRRIREDLNTELRESGELRHRELTRP